MSIFTRFIPKEARLGVLVCLFSLMLGSASIIIALFFENKDLSQLLAIGMVPVAIAGMTNLILVNRRLIIASRNKVTQPAPATNPEIDVEPELEKSGENETPEAQIPPELKAYYVKFVALDTSAAIIKRIRNIDNKYPNLGLERKIEAAYGQLDNLQTLPKEKLAYIAAEQMIS